jgi:leucyl aminopeptidase
LLSNEEAEKIKTGEIGTILALTRSQFDELIEALERQTGDADFASAFVSTNKFKPGNVLPLPRLGSDLDIPILRKSNGIGSSLSFLLCMKEEDEAETTTGSSGLSNLESSFHGVIKQLPKASAGQTIAYRIVYPGRLDGYDDVLSCLLGAYNFNRYKSQTNESDDATCTNSVPALIWPHDDTAINKASAAARASYLVRDLISTPAIDFGPEDLQVAAESLATRYGAHVQTVIGEELRTYSANVSDGHGCGMIYAVGQGAAPDREPRLIDMRWTPSSGAEKDMPTITLVGKGITYDTGGLNLKPGSSMLNMKKDMGGAAHVLGVASLLFETQVEANIRVLIPAAENCIGSNAYRPGDIVIAVNGTTTEIGNTDAEGRLVLGDALAIASADKPDAIIDFATLTGAARVALGQEIPAFLSNCDELAQEVLSAAVASRDPVWRLPLWQPYEKRIVDSSQVADLRNIPTDGGLGGAITAALYLQQFVCKDIQWAHFDIYGMRGTSGVGEAQGIRAVAELIRTRYAGQ